MKKQKKIRSIERVKSTYGRYFVFPWVIGIIMFFIMPLAQSFRYALSKVELTPTGFSVKYVGLFNYNSIFNSDPNYVKNLIQSLIDMASSLPVLIIISYLLAIILNQKFKGRIFFRAIFFLPVIITTGVVLELLFGIFTPDGGALSGANATSSTGTESVFQFAASFEQLGFPARVNEIYTMIVNNIVTIIWNCGIQILLFISGMQTVPEQLYEVAKVEGSSKWEEFWFITFPLTSRVLILVTVFTMIELFTLKTNKVIIQAYNQMTNQTYDTSSAMLWVYFAIVAGILAIVLGLFNRLAIKRWE